MLGTWSFASQLSASSRAAGVRLLRSIPSHPVFCRVVSMRASSVSTQGAAVRPSFKLRSSTRARRPARATTRPADAADAGEEDFYVRSAAARAATMGRLEQGRPPMVRVSRFFESPPAC